MVVMVGRCGGFFFVSCGMGGRFVVVVVWVVGFVVNVGIMVVVGLRTRETKERDTGRERKNKKIIKKEYLNEVLKK